MALNLEIEITLEDVRLIMEDRFDEFFRRPLHTMPCPYCKKEFDATLVIKEIWLNHIGDIIVEGWCKDCGNPMSKYIEANNLPNAYEHAMALRELKMDVLNDYNARLAGS